MGCFDNPVCTDINATHKLVMQRMHYYDQMNEDVVKDMKQKFGIIASLTQELYKFLYYQEIKRSMIKSRKEVQNKIVEKSKIKSKTEYENDTVVNKGNDTEDIDFNNLELNQVDGEARTVPTFITNQEPKRKMEYLLIEVNKEQNIEL